MSAYFASCDKDPLISPEQTEDDGTGFIPTSTLTANVNKLIYNFQEIIKLQNAVVEQASEAVGKTLSGFLRNSFKPMKEGRNFFGKVSTELDNALYKNSAVSKSKVNDVDEASNLLIASQSAFNYSAVDYVYSITMIQSRKRHEILDALLRMVNAYGAFFHQGEKMYKDSKQFAQELNTEIKEMRQNTTELEKAMESRHADITKESELTAQKMKQRPTRISATVPLDIQGYLFKRGQNAFRTWNRRWFYLKVRTLLRCI